MKKKRFDVTLQKKGIVMQKCCDLPLTTSHKSKRSSMKTQSIYKRRIEIERKELSVDFLRQNGLNFAEAALLILRRPERKGTTKLKRGNDATKKALVLVLLISYISLKFTPKSGFHTGTKSESVVDKAQTC